MRQDFQEAAFSALVRSAAPRIYKWPANFRVNFQSTSASTRRVLKRFFLRCALIGLDCPTESTRLARARATVALVTGEIAEIVEMSSL
jgi:hypothetical protein